MSDRGTCFTSKAFEDFCERQGIKHTVNSPRHPQATGQVERLNATLVPAIRSNLEEDDGRTWDKRIRKIQSDVNEMKNASTGYSPFELVYGYVPRRDEGATRRCTPEGETMYRDPADLQKDARQNIIVAQQRMKQRYDAGRMQNVELSVGTIVYMKTTPTTTGESTKLHAKYRGPLVIVRKFPSDTYHVTDLNPDAGGRCYATTAHASQLKIWKPARDESEDESEDDDGGEETTTPPQTSQSDHSEVMTSAKDKKCEDANVERKRVNASVHEVRTSGRERKPPRYLDDFAK